jgi:hypothetical protein
MNSFNTRSFKKLTLPLLDGYSTARGIGMGILCKRCSLPNSTVRLPYSGEALLMEWLSIKSETLEKTLEHFTLNAGPETKTVVIDGLQALYGSKAKTYPLGVRLQYVASLKPTKLAAAVKNLNGSQNSRLRREINEIQERIHLTEAAVNAY